MTWDDLKFKPEDFIKYNSLQHDGKGMVLYPSILADAANRILKEKLEKAPEATGWEDYFSWWPTDKDGTGDVPLKLGPATHTARLVCIEEIKK